MTPAPLPNIRNLFLALFKSQLIKSNISDPWCKPRDSCFWFSRSAWSLYLIVKLRLSCIIDLLKRD